MFRNSVLILNEVTLAVAILDRQLHHSVRIEFSEETMCKQYKQMSLQTEAALQIIGAIE